MGLIDVFVRRPVLTVVLVLIALVLGVVSYSELGLRRFPEFEFPFATIVHLLSRRQPGRDRDGHHEAYRGRRQLHLGH